MLIYFANFLNLHNECWGELAQLLLIAFLGPGPSHNPPILTIHNPVKSQFHEI
jgi:hypothetical protein